MTKFKTYYIAQNTGWSGGISWFDTDTERYDYLEGAKARNERFKNWIKDPSIQFRVKEVTIRNTYYYD